MKKVVIYSTPTCVHCNRAKEYFKANKVEYDDRNVAFDLELRRDMIMLSDQKSVPVIVIDKKVIVGFDKERIEKALENA
jgi:glutaredoxin-like YruB-family protein